MIKGICVTICPPANRTPLQILQCGCVVPTQSPDPNNGGYCSCLSPVGSVLVKSASGYLYCGICDLTTHSYDPATNICRCNVANAIPSPSNPIICICQNPAPYLFYRLVQDLSTQNYVVTFINSM